MMVVLQRTTTNETKQFVAYTDRQGHLFGYPTLTITEGTDLCLSRERHMTFATEAERQTALRRMINSRLRQGYDVLYSYFRSEGYSHVRKALERQRRHA